MGRCLDLRTFSARLIVTMVILILLTTLSAGLPAYWLTRTELRHQAALYVDGAQQSTQSLLHAEAARLMSTVTLLSERPTLHRLLSEGNRVELQRYLQAFQQRSGSDQILLCGPDGAPLIGDPVLVDCQPPTTPVFRLLGDQAALLATQPVRDERSGAALGTLTMVTWLDRAFLAQMAAATGVEQSILLADGTRLASTLSTASELAVVDRREPQPRQPGNSATQLLRVGNQQYNVATLPMTNADAPVQLYIEVALSINDLLATEQRALSIMAASTGLIALSALLLGILFVRRLTKPLRQLTMTAKAISQGELTTPVPTFIEPLEVATLATALQNSQARMLQAVQELAGARDWLDNLIQTVVEGIVTFDRDGFVIFVNQKAAELTPFSAETAIGRHLNDLFPVAEEGSPTFSDLLPRPGHQAQITVGQQVRAVGSSHTARLANRFGHTAHRRLSMSTVKRKSVLEVTATRLTGLGNGDEQIALVLRDLSEEQLLHNLRSYFLANITHEFRTPLSTFNASIELLMNEEEAFTTDEMRTLLKPVHLSLVSLQTLVDNLLESSRIEAGRFVLQKRPLLLRQLLANALQMVQPLLDRRRQTITLSEPTILPTLHGDGPRLTQVWVNLLTNASKYSPFGESIELLIEVEAALLRVTVADRGPGVPTAEFATLFQNFVRANNHAEDQYGVGLGLYVVKTTVEAHGGHVGIDNRPDGGSLFWVELPLDQTNGTEDQ